MNLEAIIKNLMYGVGEQCLGDEIELCTWMVLDKCRTDLGGVSHHTVCDFIVDLSSLTLHRPRVGSILSLR